MKSYYSRMLSVLLISFSLLYGGCSLIGLGTGAIIDHLSPDMKIIDPIDYTTIEHSTIITVHLLENTSKVGIFDGIDVISSTDGDIRDNVEKYLILKTKFGVEQINLDEIVSIEIDLKKNGKRNGFIIGLALDIAFLIWLSTSDISFVD